MINKKTKILDCTLRDGGYLNSWHFSREFASDLYTKVSECNIDYIELGLVYPYEENQGAGIFKYLTEDYIRNIINKNKRSKIATMIDYGKFEPKLINAKESLIDMIRVACHKKDVFGAIELCHCISSLGYESSLQLMNFPSYSELELMAVIKAIENINYVYIADSFGSIDRKVIDFGFNILSNNNFKIGFHPHNNMQSAFQNTLYAIEKGVDIVDGTVFGLGRGAGNLHLELLLLYLSGFVIHEYEVKPILSFIEKHEDYLMSLQTKKLLYYQMTGALNLHPNYATEAYEKGVMVNYLWERLKTIDNTTPYKRGIL